MFCARMGFTKKIGNSYIGWNVGGAVISAAIVRIRFRVEFESVAVYTSSLINLQKFEVFLYNERYRAYRCWSFFFRRCLSRWCNIVGAISQFI